MAFVEKRTGDDPGAEEDQMEQYVIKGGNPLVGDVEIAGAKNAALPIFAAAAMTDETVYIENIPDVSDIKMILDTMRGIGVAVRHTERHRVMLNAGNINNLVVEDEAMKKIRGSYYLLGAFLGKYKHAEVVLPGGCDIGCRAIDQHLKGFRALGAEVYIEHGLVKARAERLQGSHIYMDKVSVGATINVMIAATLAEGTTIIENSAKEPHVVDVANFLNSCGANIKGAGTDVIRIKGVQKLHGTEYAIIPDQIEAGTFMPAGGSLQAPYAHPGENPSLPWFSHGHAAPDHGGPGPGKRNQHCDREHLREPFQVCGSAYPDGGGHQGGRRRHRHH